MPEGCHKTIKLNTRSLNQITTAQRFSTTSLIMSKILGRGPILAASKTQLPATIQQSDITADHRALNVVPALVADLGDEGAWRYVEFFTANLRSPHTRRVYFRACNQFLASCEERGLTLATIRPHDVATYVEQLQNEIRAQISWTLKRPISPGSCR
jgi:hypothetical protein